MARSPLVKIDLSHVSAPNQLHAILSAALGFPDWYGQNWDAFWDAITSLVEMPITLELAGWSGFSQRLPREATLMQQCLAQMTAEYPDLAPEVYYID
ncbi:ribonuclease inhibitor [Pseudomonas sp. CCM 7891]|uniref:Ribonuclease inhibitor n=1 Tax=Pseudomonas karstica TaxID=1055468 RepID=A0A7X2RRZ2_9PSED|nr:barstar family protein [Pseudomonas karstica]MTD19879.1 ribonuclease inhibitor [Pseudomonas karstica]